MRAVFLVYVGNDSSRCDLPSTASILLEVPQILFQILACIEYLSMLAVSAACTDLLEANRCDRCIL